MHRIFDVKDGINPTPILHTICAFANDIDNIGGGYLIVGVDERAGRPVLPPRGIPDDEVDDSLKQLLNLCHFIEPLYQPVAEPVFHQGRWIIVVWVAAGFGRPYKVPKDVLAKDKSNKRFYIRKSSSTVVASADEERELFYRSQTIPFDDQPNLAADVEELSRPLMRDYLRQVGSALYEESAHMDTLDIARRMQLVAGPPEAMEITSFPGFDRSISQERIDVYDLRCDVYRNRRIGDFLKELGLCEGRNTGFPKALDALDRNGSPRPTFRMDEARGFLTVRLAVHPAFAPRETVAGRRAGEYEERIREALAAGPLSLSELSRAMGYKSIPKRLTTAVDRMATSGTVVRIVTGARSKLALVVD